MDRSRSSLLWIAAGLLIGVGLGMIIFFGAGPGITWFQRDSRQAVPPAVPELNQPAPDISLRTLEGESVRLSDLQGKVVVLNFWATWCGPCRLEMPLLQEYADRYGQDVVVLAINNDEPLEIVQKFVDDLSLRMKILLDPNAEVTQQYRVRGFPTTIFIDQDGLIRYQHIGVLNEDLLLGYLQEIGAIE